MIWASRALALALLLALCAGACRTVRTAPERTERWPVTRFVDPVTEAPPDAW